MVIDLNEVSGVMTMIAGMIGSGIVIMGILLKIFKHLNKKENENLVKALNDIISSVNSLETKVDGMKDDIKMVMKTEHIMLKHLVTKNSTGELKNTLQEFDLYIIEKN